MLKAIKGDVIYASKLRMSSFGVALLKKLTSFKPVIVDIDDLETSWFSEQDWHARRKTPVKIPIGLWHTKLMEKLTWAADDITTVSTQLQKKFGGVIVPHGKDTEHLNPDRHDRKRLRKELGIDEFRIVMFLGTPRRHKGLEDILDALKLIGRKDIKLFIVGKGSDPFYEKKLQELGGEQVILHKMIPFNRVPEFLAVADSVVLAQRKSLITWGQIPAKLFDAMSMAKPIIASNVSDMPDILRGCGLIFEPGNIRELAEKLQWIFSHPRDAEEMGQRAREKCIREYSWNVMEERLSQIFDKYK